MTIAPYYLRNGERYYYILLSYFLKNMVETLTGRTEKSINSSRNR